MPRWRKLLTIDSISPSLLLASCESTREATRAPTAARSSCKCSNWRSWGWAFTRCAVSSSSYKIGWSWGAGSWAKEAPILARACLYSKVASINATLFLRATLRFIAAHILLHISAVYSAYVSTLPTASSSRTNGAALSPSAIDSGGALSASVCRNTGARDWGKAR